MGDARFNKVVGTNLSRICREVATERDLFNVHGTFYELPAENADGFAKIRPIASHSLAIHDYASFRGMLVLTGVASDQKNTPHIIQSADGKASVWAGTIDDLWKLGKPVGIGGPWKNASVKSGEHSDPYLLGFYDTKSLRLSHDSNRPVTFRIEVDPIGHGPWMLFMEVTVKPGSTFEYSFGDGFQARWIRFAADRDCRATATLTYK